MLRYCTRTTVKARMVNPCGLVKSCHLVKPVSTSLVTGRWLTNQTGLPRQPVPSLQQTCEHYLKILEPIVEEDELKHTTELVKEFQRAGGVGERLQGLLERRAHHTENWLSDYFVQKENLENRDPVVLYSNTSCLFPRMDFRDRQGQIRCAAKMITAVLDMKTMIESETLPVEYKGGKPLCMNQYSQIFSSCRVPGPETDSLVFHAKSSNKPKHLTVIHNSQFFVVEVYNTDGTLLTVDQLCLQLERIYNSSLETNLEPVGILTTLHRDSWSKAYSSLVKDKITKDSLSAIDRSIFTVCLDGAMPQVSDEMYTSRSSLQLLHGGGSQWNSANRWFDKTIQLIIGEDGTCGFNMTHAAADGTIFMTLSDHVVTFINRKKPEMMQSPMVPLPMPQKLHFNVTPDIKKDIEEAKQSMDILAQILDVRMMVFDHFGKKVLKDLKMSPDPLVQMSIQLAYYRLLQRCCSSYEAVSMRMFRHGRVGTICSTSSASAAFVKAFDNPKQQNTEKLHFLAEAMKVHRQNTNMAINGQDIDAHLLGLKMQVVDERISMPDIFTDVSYKKFLDYRLSTSQVTSTSDCLPMSCPAQPELYDICYSLAKDYITFVITAANSFKENNPAQLMQAIKDALLDMRTLLEQAPKSTSTSS